MTARPYRVEADGLVWIKRTQASLDAMEPNELGRWIDDQMGFGAWRDPLVSRGVWLEWYSPETEHEREARERHDAAAEERRHAHCRRLMRAVLDPGAFTPRGADAEGEPYGEPMDAWQERAMAIALQPTREEREA